MEGKVDAEYAKCVDLCTKASLKEMVLPTMIAIVVPVITGVVLGPTGVIGMLCGATISGFLLAVFMSNSGGAWSTLRWAAAAARAATMTSPPSWATPSATPSKTSPARPSTSSSSC